MLLTKNFFLVLFFCLVTSVLSAQDSSNSDDITTNEENEEQPSGLTLKQEAILKSKDESWTSIFPLLRDRVPRKQRVNLPRPFGANFVFYQQTFDAYVAGIDVGSLGDITEGNDRNLKDQIPITTVTSAYTFRLDLWLFPFLQVYGLSGPLRNSTSASGPDLPGADCTRPFKCEIGQFNGVYDALSIDTDGSYSSLGFVAAYGFWNLAISANYSYVWYVFNGSTVPNSTAHNLVFRGIYRFKKYFNPFVGASFLNIRTPIVTVGEGDQTLSISISKPKAWSPTVGFEGQIFSEHFQYVVEVAMGERFYLTTNLGYRF